MRTPFFGPSYVASSPDLADQQLINLYPTLVETKTGKAVGAFYLCPGLDRIATAGNGPIQAMRRMNDTLYVVSGYALYSVGASYVPTLLGSVNSPGAYVFGTGQINPGFQSATLPFQQSFPTGVLTPVVMSDNGLQVIITVGATVTQQDGFGLINQPGSYIFWQSDLLDMTSWRGLNFASASGDSGRIVALAQAHREIFIIQEESTELWVNGGQPGFTFQRLEGAFVENGSNAPATVTLVGESLMWLARNRNGRNVVIRMEGFVPRVVSTQALTEEWDSYGTTADAMAYAYEAGGRTFYVLSFPTGNTTWAYDVTSSALGSIPMWHRRAAFSGGAFNRHPAQVGTWFNNQIIIGDGTNGNLYKFNPNTLLDNGAQRKWLRSWRASPAPSEQPVRFSSLRIDMQTGIGVPDGTDPLCILRWSDDGGHTWSNEKYAHAGPPGATAQRVKFNRLGSTRRNSGLDRIFELSSSDVFPARLIGAELE